MQNQDPKTLGLSNWKEASKLALLGLSRSPRTKVNHPQLAHLFESGMSDALEQTSNQSETSEKQLAPPSVDQGLKTLSSAEGQFLDFIASLSLYQEAGTVALSKESLGDLMHFAPAPPDSRILIHQLKLENVESLQHTPLLFLKYLTHLKQAQVMVPPTTIPYLLELGIKLNQHMETEDYEALKACLKNIVAERGQWLIKLNPKWYKHYGLSLNEKLNDVLDLWYHGKEAERKSSLKLLRQLDPDLARSSLMQDFHKERALLRQSLLSILKVNLSSADESFLEACLDDRSQAVQHVAASLLVCLPDSAYVARQTQNLSRYVSLSLLCETYQMSAQILALPKDQESLIHITLPKTKLNESEVRDGLAYVSTKGYATIRGGQKINRLAELIRCVPLSWWTEQFRNKPTVNSQETAPQDLNQIIELLVGEVEKHDHAEALVNAWIQAYIHQSYIHTQQASNAARLDVKQANLQSPKSVSHQESWQTLHQVWGQALLQATKRRSIDGHALFMNALPLNILRAELISCLQAHDQAWLGTIMADHSEWSLEFSFLVMQAINLELSKIKKRNFPKGLDEVIAHVGLHADINVQVMIDQEWRAYQDYLPSPLLSAVNLCQQRFILRTEIQKQIQDLPSSPQTIPHQGSDL